MHLEQITFDEDLILGKKKIFAKDKSFIFKHPITLLVGDQGCGKSTLIDVLIQKHKVKATLQHNSSEYFALDTEKDNPRLKREIRKEGTGFQIASHFASHGETIFALMKMINQGKNCIFFIDEPESGLSIRSQWKLLEIMNKGVDRGIQFVIATHSFILIQSQKEVLDLEKKKWCSSSTFLKNQKPDKKAP